MYTQVRLDRHMSFPALSIMLLLIYLLSTYLFSSNTFKPRHLINMISSNCSASHPVIESLMSEAFLDLSNSRDNPQSGTEPDSVPADAHASFTLLIYTRQSAAYG